MRRASSPRTSAASIGRMPLLRSWMASIPTPARPLEVGYAYGKKPVILVRTDFRRTGSGAPYNAILAQSATIRLDLPSAPISRVVTEILDALRRLENGSP